MKTVIEPYRNRMVEPIRMTTRAQRESFIREAGYNPFQLRAEQVIIDLVTDSGTSALSTHQWSCMLGADESFTGSRSFYRFRDAAQALLGHSFILPCHQGRAAEHLIARALLRPGDVTFSNTHFSTTRENFEEAGAEVRDLSIPEATDMASDHPFKGNIDLLRLEAGIAEVGAGKVRFVVITVTDNSHGGQPVSLANLRGAREICQRHGVPLLLDAARFAENAYLVKLRDPEASGLSARQVAERIFRLTDGVFMSLKKDGLGNTGGLIATNSAEWAEKIRVCLLASEGIPTAGGLAGRDLESLAAALDEVLDEDYLAYRVASTTAFGEQLARAGVPVLKPFGPHAIYIDGRACCPHLPDEQLPAWSLSVALYLHGGVRAWETGNVMQGRRDEEAGTWTWPALDLMRLAVPRRVYSSAHLAYAAEAMIEVYERRHEVRGLKFVYRPPALAQFVATFEPV